MSDRVCCNVSHSASRTEIHVCIYSLILHVSQCTTACFTTYKGMLSSYCRHCKIVTQTIREIDFKIKMSHYKCCTKTNNANVGEANIIQISFNISLKKVSFSAVSASSVPFLYYAE